MILFATAIAYCNSFSGVFLLDDYGHIVTSESIKSVFPLGQHLGEYRPLVHLSLSINYAISGLETWSYHAVNLLIHVAAALTLFGLARRLLLQARGPSLDRSHATWLALVIALLWAVHPLQTQSVTYIIQRGESLMGLAYLLTLYCFVRGAGASRPRLWMVASVLACAAGMLSKEAMVTAPVMVWLVDAIFITRRWIEPIRRRWLFYAALLTTIGLLAMQGLFSDILHGSKKHGADIGLHVQGLTPWRYLLTQPEVILHYLRLCLWPYPQCFDYGWEPVAGWREVIVPGFVIVGVVLATLWLLRTRPELGFLGAWWFIILAPTSSIVPIKDFAFEQRMYLPLAAVITALVLAFRRLFSGVPRETAMKRSAVIVSLAAVALIGRTIRRNADYASAVAMWSDVVRQRPGHARAWNYLGVGLAVEGKQGQAIAAYEKALALTPESEEVHTNLARSLVKSGRAAEALPHFEASLRQVPDDAMLHHSHAIALERAGRIDEAHAEYRRTLELQPDHPFAHFNMGLALKNAGRWEEAVRAFEIAARRNAADDAAFYQLGSCLLRLGRRAEAMTALRQAVKINPASEARSLLGS